MNAIPTATPIPGRPQRRWSWALVPIVGIGATAVANVVMLTAALRTNAENVEAQPFAHSADHDREKQAEARFAARGLTLDAEGVAGGLRCASAGPALRDAVLHVYRPDDSRLDRRVRWSDSGAPLDVALPRPGMWRLRLEAQLDGEPVRWSGSVDVPR